jgi:hypothetical protein
MNCQPAIVGKLNAGSQLGIVMNERLLIGISSLVLGGMLSATAPQPTAAGPQACTAAGTVVTCQGDQSGGIRSGVDFNAPPTDALVVNNLTQNITPAAGIDGIRFISSGAVNVTSDTGSFGIVTTGIATGIIATSEGQGGSNAGNVTVAHSGNITALLGIEATSMVVEGGAAAGAVSVTNNGNFVGGTAITAISQAGGGAGNVTVNNTGNLDATGGAGIVARTTVGGINTAGTVDVVNTGNIVSRLNGITASSSSAGTASNVTVQSTGNITSTLFSGIAGTSEGALGNGNISINILGGTVRGSGNAGTAGVQFFGGADNDLVVQSTATVAGTGPNGFAVLGGTGNDVVTNFGTVTGNVDLGAGINEFGNNVGALLNSGQVINFGERGNLTNAGTIAPGGVGAAPTTTAIIGNLILAGGGTFAVDVNRTTGTADRLNVVGLASVAGTVLPTVTGVSSVTQQFTILSTSGGITDNGITVADTAAFDFELILNGLTMVLSVTANFEDPNTGAGLTPNQQAVASHIQDVLAAGNGNLGALVAHLGSITDPRALAAALDRLHPEPYLAQTQSTLFASLGFTDSLMSCPAPGSPTANAFIAEGQCAWTRMGGRVLDVDRTDANIGFTDKSWGGAAGVQFSLAPNWLGSVALGYDRSDIQVDDRASASGGVLHIGAGAKYTLGNWQFSGAVAGGRARYETVRFDVMPGLNAAGEASIDFVSGRLRSAYVFGSDRSYVKPLVDLDATGIRRDGFTETGAGPAGLNVRGQTDVLFSLAPAVEIGGQFSYASGGLLRPFLRAGARFFNKDELSATANFIGTPSGVSDFTATTPLGQWMGEVSTGLEILGNDRYDARISYEGRFAERTTQHGGSLKLRARF